METTSPLPGYDFVEILGRGGFGIVYRAWQRAVGRHVAVKIDGRVLATEREHRRFLREVAAAGRLSGHSHVVAIHDAGVLPDGRPYLVMELCPGGSLDTVLRNIGPLAPEEVRRLGVGIADALATAHAAGILHRDVKPANILLNQYGVAGLADFGLASILDADGAQSATREALTPAYAAPEAFRLEDPTDRFDVYSLSATLYALLAGRPPRFPETGQPSIPTILALHEEPVGDIPGIHPGLTSVLRQALSNDPAERPTAAGFRDQLAGLAPETMAGDPPGLGRLPGAGNPAMGTADPGTFPAPTAPPLPFVPDAPVPTMVPTSPAPTTVAPGLPGKRRRRTLVWAAVSVLAVLGIALLTIPAVRSATSSARSSTGASADGTSADGTSDTETGHSDSPNPDTGTMTGTTGGNRTLANDRPCPASAVDGSATCPVTAECWAGMVFSSGVLLSVRSVPCDEEHAWETFALLPLPADAGITNQPDRETIEASPTVQRVCSIDVLSSTVSGPAAELAADDWETSILPPTQAKFDSGERTVRCVVTVVSAMSLGSAVYPDAHGYTTT